MSCLLSEELLKIPYFHEAFNSIDEVLNALIQYLNKNGHFLVRPSQSRPNCLTISVTDNSTVKHFNIHSYGGTYSLDSRKFSSIEDLCNFYKWNDVPNIEGYKNVRLLHPIRNLAFPTRTRFASFANLSPDDPFFANPFHHSPHQQSMTLKNTSKGQIRRKLSMPALTFNQSQVLKFDNQYNDDSINRSITDSFDLGESCLLDSPSPSKNGKVNQNNPVNPLSTDDTNSNNNATQYNNSNINNNSSNNNINNINESPYYSTARHRDTSVLDGVLEYLKRLESSELCVCGLPLSETELPQGWSVHLSTESETAGRLFFTSPDGNTAWKLPSDIRHRLSPSQKDFIKLLKQNNEKSSISSPKSKLSIRSTFID